MASDASGDEGARRKRPANGAGEPGPELPVERSSRGKIVIRSSSHPPAGTAEPEPRVRRDTPAERPRRRRERRAAQMLERPRRDTPAAGGRRRSPAGLSARSPAPERAGAEREPAAPRDQLSAYPLLRAARRAGWLLVVTAAGYGLWRWLAG